RSVFAPVVSPDSPFSRGADRQRRQSAACSSKVMPGQATQLNLAARIYTDKDVDLRWLKGKTCAVIGFGSQGRAQALNLRDSGIKVIVGLYPGSKSRVRARRSGLIVLHTADAARRGDIVFLAL